MQDIAEKLKSQIENQLGKIERVGDGRSLFNIPSINTFIYFRYSKISDKRTPSAFFGLRKKDVDIARGNNFYVCFVTDSQKDVFLIPFADFEMCYDYVGASDDGQYKTQLFFKPQDVELYIPKSGKFSAESYRGIDEILNKKGLPSAPPLDHTGAQSLVGAIGAMKGHRVWFPKNDLEKIDRGVMDFSNLCKKLPTYGPTVDSVFREIDVIWVNDDKPVALFEIEHSTPIYSGLLRMNDVLISSAGAIDAKIVAEQTRRDTFQRQIRRPTFEAHKLEEKVSFISYDNIWRWSETLREKNL